MMAVACAGCWAWKAISFSFINIQALLFSRAVAKSVSLIHVVSISLLPDYIENVQCYLCVHFQKVPPHTSCPYLFGLRSSKLNMTDHIPETMKEKNFLVSFLAVEYPQPRQAVLGLFVQSSMEIRSTLLGPESSPLWFHPTLLSMLPQTTP